MTRRVCVVGSGSRFVSGISYFTVRLTNALAERHAASAVLMRQLLPTALYPGRARVGADIMRVGFDPRVPVCDGVDWFWGATIVRAVAFLRRERPEVVVLQWWTGTVLHTYLALAVVSRLLGARVVIEFHETLDTSEAEMPLVRAYAGAGVRALVRLSSAFVVHSEFDRDAVQAHYALRGRPVAVIPHGPFDHHVGQGAAPQRVAPATATNLLFFGVVRPYKGLLDLVAAFEALRDQGADVWLTVVGETWEGYDAPRLALAASPHRDRVTLVDRYVDDEEVPGFFEGADVVVLPYHRSSASGPLHMAMSHGLPVVVTAVGGLTDVAGAYAGAVLVPPRDPARLADGILEATTRTGTVHADAGSWEASVERFSELFEQVLAA